MNDQQSITPEFALMCAAIGMPINTAWEVKTKSGDWDESKHPRADNGRFGEGASPADRGMASAKRDNQNARDKKPFKNRNEDDLGSASAQARDERMQRGEEYSSIPRDSRTSSAQAAADARARENFRNQDAAAAEIESAHPDTSPPVRTSTDQAAADARARDNFSNQDAAAKIIKGGEKRSMTVPISTDARGNRVYPASRDFADSIRNWNARLSADRRARSDRGAVPTGTGRAAPSKRGAAVK